MDETEAAELSPADEADKRYLTVRQAAFIGVGAMVDAGIFALLGAVGEVAGAAGAAVMADRPGSSRCCRATRLWTTGGSTFMPGGLRMSSSRTRPAAAARVSRNRPEELR
jgi:hypothetical protein